MHTIRTDNQDLLRGSSPADTARARWHASPRKGESLAAPIESLGKPVREAVSVLAKGFFLGKLENIISHIFGNRNKSADNLNSLAMRAAWNLVSICLTARSSGQCSPRCGFKESELWFHGSGQITVARLSTQVSNESLCDAEQLLNSVELDSRFRALFPYILEEHGPGSRASVIKDPTTESARAAKRESGIFYTPADVADYMIDHVRQNYRGDFLAAKCLDPSCGTGVFLLALLLAAVRIHGEPNRFSRLDYIVNCLFGLDISGHALDAASFVLLHECISEIMVRNFSPLSAWRLIRRNLVEADALCVGVIERNNEKEGTELFDRPLSNLAQFFPQAQDGFDILIGNPPYAALGERQDFDSLSHRFASLHGAKHGKRLNTFPLFVEMMWQFTKRGCNSSALVTPLSLAFHRGAQIKNCRQKMSCNGGRWQFAFFDREPHALFGEEVKTRNAIIFRSEHSDTPKRGEVANIETGPLRKWTSRTRERLFKSTNFTQVDSIEIASGIPKLDGPIKSKGFMTLMRRLDRLPSSALQIKTCKPVEALSGKKEAKVFVGGTAYNFLNVYRPASLLPEDKGMTLSESSVHCLEFKTELEARLAFAILSSRLTFWLWHVIGDGFHVAGWFFKDIPFSLNSFTNAERDSLSALGEKLWLKVQTHRFTSLNAGRLTIGFRPLAFHEERDAIDAILATASGLGDEFVADLRLFVQENVVVDSTDTRRNLVNKYFKEGANL